MGEVSVTEKGAAFMKESLHQNLLDFKLEKTKDHLTSKSGLSVFYEAACALGVVEAISECLPKPLSNRGIQPKDYVMPMVLMLCGGGRSLEDIREIDRDKGLRELCGLKKIPSSDALSKWLRKNGTLQGLKKVNVHGVKEILVKSGKTDFTLDVDATFIETEKHCAKKNYEGNTSFSVLLSYVSELALCVASDYRNGNESPQTGILEQVETTEKMLKSLGLKLKYLRSDSAAYQSKVMNFCFDPQHRIVFTITADQDAAVKETLATIKEKDWEPLCDEHGHPTGDEVAVAYHSMEKTKQGFKLVVKRWRNKQLDLFEQEDYCYYVIATSDEEKSPQDLLLFHNQRGQSENFHKELKLGFSMEYTPSQSLCGNAVYFELGVLAYNLTQAVKLLVLKGGWVTKTIATLRWQFLLIAGKVVKHGRTLFLKVREDYFHLLFDFRMKLRKILAFG